MPVRLYHRTTDDAVAPIIAEGFRDGEDGGVWFSAELDCWGERGRWLLEVMLDLDESDIERYAVGVVSDEEWDDETDEWVKSEHVETFRWFKIPAEVVNARGRSRFVPPEEDQLLRLGLLELE